VFTSTLLSRLMDRYPIIIYLGAAILGRVGGEMIMTDDVIVKALQPSPVIRYGMEALCAAGVVLAGFLLSRRYQAGR
jgi:predicted tellurium resistance membrane protein TerC